MVKINLEAVCLRWVLEGVWSDRPTILSSKSNFQEIANNVKYLIQHQPGSIRVSHSVY